MPALASVRVICGPVEVETVSGHRGVEVPIPTALRTAESNTNNESEDRVSAAVVKRTVFTPPKVEIPVPPFATERSVPDHCALLMEAQVVAPRASSAVTN